VIPSLKPADLQTQPINPSRVMRDMSRMLIQTAAQPDELPDLQVGEEIIARLAEDLGDNRFAILIKNKLFTLDFPPFHKPQSDFVKLKIQALHPRLVFALLDPLGVDGQKENPAVRVLLSSTSRYLNDLLLRGKYQDTISTQALLPSQRGGDAPLPDSKLLAATLRQMVAQDGVHYESHLKAWFEGRKTLQELFQHPQAMLASRLTRIAAQLNPDEARLAMAELGYILQRQMELLNYRALFMNMLLWPGQTMEFRMEEEEQEQQKVEEEQEKVWVGRLRLELPRLGTLAIAIHYRLGKTEIRITTEQKYAFDALSKHQQNLVEAFKNSGLNLSQIGIEHA
jgi:hypothetical protein